MTIAVHWDGKRRRKALTLRVRVDRLAGGAVSVVVVVSSIRKGWTVQVARWAP